MAYDIFISYRREGGEDIARQLELALENYGYSVFLDFDACDDGRFETKIKKGIEEAPIFILILSHGALDRCANSDDWVLQEIQYAISLNKKIISVCPDTKFEGIPETLPKDVYDYLAATQVSELRRGQLFKSSLELLVNNRISKIVPPNKNIVVKVGRKNMWKYLLVVVAIVALIGGVFYINHQQEQERVAADVALFMSIVSKSDSLSLITDSLFEADLCLKEARQVKQKYDGTEYAVKFYEDLESRSYSIKEKINDAFDTYKRNGISAYEMYISDVDNFSYEREIAITNFEKALKLREDDELRRLRESLDKI